MTILLFILALIVLFFISVFSFLRLFYRDPRRIPPDKENLILSPADGRVGYIKHIKSGEIKFSEKKRREINLAEILRDNIDETQEYILIGILMSFFNVHFQRAPIDGTVYNQEYIKGKFLDIRFSKKILEFEGERNIIYFKNNTNNLIAIVMQIASNSVKRIVSYVTLDENVKKGQKIGLIRFGSQVDLIIPTKNVQLLISEKSKVKAGLTIIGEYKNA